MVSSGAFFVRRRRRWKGSAFKRRLCQKAWVGPPNARPAPCRRGRWYRNAASYRDAGLCRGLRGLFRRPWRISVMPRAGQYRPTPKPAGLRHSLPEFRSGRRRCSLRSVEVLRGSNGQPISALHLDRFSHLYPFRLSAISLFSDAAKALARWISLFCVRFEPPASNTTICVPYWV